MRALLWLYIALFVTLTVLSVLDPGATGTAAEMTFDLVVDVIALIGLVAYAVRLNAPRMIAAWKYVAPALLVAFVLQMVVAWPDLMAPDPELSSAEHYGIVSLALAAGVLLLTPAVIVNFRFARGRHLDAAR